MRKIVFHSSAFEDFTNWATINIKIFNHLKTLIKESARNPFTGIGNPEPLKFDKKGYWSRRINSEHRLVYKVTDDMIIIISCKYHY